MAGPGVPTHVVIRVADEFLRGIPFRRCTSVPRNRIEEAFTPRDVVILPGAATALSVDGRMEGDDMAEMLGHARYITLPDQWGGLVN
jgi:hypothetical protein